MNTVLVLGGGPEAERPVSLPSARAIAPALARPYPAVLRTCGRLTGADLARLPGDVVFPALHGLYGEGGPLQDGLETDGRPYVGSTPATSRACMDKMGAKLVCASLGLTTPRAGVYDPRDDGLPLPLPFVLKPTHDGSSVGLHICRTMKHWDAARQARRADVRETAGRCFMAERVVSGRELTAGVIGPAGAREAHPIVAIRAA